MTNVSKVNSDQKLNDRRVSTLRTTSRSALGDEAFESEIDIIKREHEDNDLLEKLSNMQSLQEY